MNSVQRGHAVFLVNFPPSLNIRKGGVVYMREYSKMLNNYICGTKDKDGNFIVKSLEEKVGKHNGKIITDSIEKLRAMPSEPSDSRLYTVVNRWKTLAEILNKNFNELTEADLINLNNEMRSRGMASAKYYRKALKQILKLMDRKKYFDLIESPYLVESRKKNGSKKLVDPEDFWTIENMVKYNKECQYYSLKLSAWGGIWSAFGLRPQEILDLSKKRITYETGKLTIKVIEGKTGSRIVILEGNEAVGVWELIKPYLETLKDDDLLFPFTYEYIYKVHNRLCEKIGITKGESRKLYISRKMTLSHFYNSFGVAKASSMAGHVAGSNSMKHYVALTEFHLSEGIPRLQKRICPHCGNNSASSALELSCLKCKSPLEIRAYEKIVQNSNEEQVNEIQDLKERIVRNEENLAKVLKHILEAKA